MRFYSPEINVHPGTQLNFNLQGFHTATAIPEGEDIDAWRAANVAPGGPFTIAVPDPDDTPLDPTASSPDRESLKFNNGVFFPTDFACGAEDNPCSYDGTGVLNSGVVSPTFSTTIDTAPNSDFWLLCLIHPSMTLHANVVPPAETATTQADVDAYRDATTVTDAQEAADTHQDFVNRRRKRNGVWRAWSGIDGEGFALLGMYPRKLTIKKGQRVRWSFDKLIHEIHTVTMPIRPSPAFDEFFAENCDPDGDAGPGPDTPPVTEDPPFCATLEELEFDLPARGTYETGNGVFRGADYENSGISPGPGANPYTVKFSKRSSKKGFKYFCMIHGRFQRGNVVVKRR
jgi:plastocyanin